jgi:hypothetical protein
MSARLDDFGDVLTRDDLCKLMSWSKRTVQSLQKQERELDIRCLPVEIPGFKNRYTKDSVARWLKVGAPQVAGRSGRKAA